MKSKIKQNKNVIYPIVIMAVLCLIVLLQTEFILESDDGRYSTAIKNGDWGLLFINNRVLVNAIAVVVENCGIIFWKVCNLVLCMLLFLYLIKIALVMTQKQEDVYTNIILCGAIFLIPLNVLSSGLFWVTGSFSYAWGLVGCLMYIYPFMKLAFDKTCTRGEIVLAIFGGIYAGNLEQSSLVQVCFAGAVLVYLAVFAKKKVKVAYWLLYLVAVISLALLLLLPYNGNRSIGAVMVYYPDFYMLSVTDKLYQGFVYLYQHILERNSILISVFSGLVFYNITKREKDTFTNILAVLPFAYFVGNVVAKTGVYNGGTVEPLYALKAFTYEYIASKAELLPFVLMTSALLIEMYLLYVIFKEKVQKLCAVLFYGAGFSSALILAFSPTIFASGNRVFFLLDVFLVLLIGLLLYQKRCDGEQNACSRYIALGICIVDLMICIKFYCMSKGIIMY